MDGFAYQGKPKTRQIRVGTSVKQGSVSTTDTACRGAVVKAPATNTGVVYVGFTSGVLAEQSATSDVVGFPLAAGDETPVLTVHNIGQIYLIGTATSDDAMILWASPDDSV